MTVCVACLRHGVSMCACPYVCISMCTTLAAHVVRVRVCGLRCVAVHWRRCISRANTLRKSRERGVSELQYYRERLRAFERLGVRREVALSVVAFSIVALRDVVVPVVSM